MKGIVVLERLREFPDDVFHPLLGCRVRGQKLRRLVVAFLFRYPLPKVVYIQGGGFTGARSGVKEQVQQDRDTESSWLFYIGARRTR